MDFKLLTPADYLPYKKCFENQPHQLCAYSLASIIAWSNEVYQPYGVVIDEMLLVCAEYATQYERRHLILPVSGQRRFDPETLHRLALEAGFEAYGFVPGDYIGLYGRAAVKKYFSIEAQPGYHDYIYNVSDLAQLRGNRYSKKRNLIRQFERSHVAPGRVRAEAITSEVADECLDFLEKWCEQRDCGAQPESDLMCEKLAAAKSIKNLATLGLSGLLLRVDGAVSAFGLVSRLTNEMGVLHFEKAFTDIKGLYQYFDRLCAQRLFAGCIFINKESDMNEAGLKKAKRSYHPVKMVKSYKLKLKA